MDSTLKAVFFVVAVILFVLAAVPVASRFNLVAAGLAAFALPFAWDAFEAA